MSGQLTVGPPVGRLGCSVAALVVSVAAAVLAPATQRSPADLSPVSAVGYLAAFASILAFVWFRSGDVEASGDRDYVVPAWNPPRVARAVALAALAVAVVHGFVIGGAVARW